MSRVPGTASTGSSQGSPAWTAATETRRREGYARPLLVGRYEDGYYILEIRCRRRRQAERIAQTIHREVLG